MGQIREELLEVLVGKRLKDELEEVKGICGQGFDVAVCSPSVELRELFFKQLMREVESGPRAYLVSESLADLEDQMELEDRKQRFLPAILVTERCPLGLGFVAYTLPAFDEFLPSVSAVVSRTLAHFKLDDTYTDVFDASKMSRIKQIAVSQGFGALIDCIIQVAYLGGFLGEEDVANHYLEQALTLPPPKKSTETSNESTHDEAKVFMAHVLAQTHHPHTYLKAALSYYVVKGRGHSMVGASRVLNISRTTLQEHLRLAQKMGIGAMFNPADSTAWPSR